MLGDYANTETDNLNFGMFMMVMLSYNSALTGLNWENNPWATSYFAYDAKESDVFGEDYYISLLEVFIRYQYNGTCSNVRPAYFFAFNEWILEGVYTDTGNSVTWTYASVQHTNRVSRESSYLDQNLENV